MRRRRHATSATRCTTHQLQRCSRRTAYSSLTRVTVRQFANKNRIRFAIRLENRGAYASYVGSSSFRLAVEDGTVIAPVSSDDEVIQAHASQSIWTVFEVPATTLNEVLRTLYADTSAELPIQLRAVPHAR
ncbi:MAG: hypothetical protein ACREL7_01135 [Longimicrobiales bacterium]